MNVREFEYLVELGRSQSLLRASRALYISQPALSKFLQKIESELGTPLFQRIGHKLVPTYAGEQCLKTASEILFLHNKLMQNIADITRSKSGKIRLGLPMSRSRYFIARILPLFHDSFPDIAVHIYEDAAKNLLKKLSDGELDFIFINYYETLPHLTFITVSSEEMVLAAPASYQLEQYTYYDEKYQFPCIAPEHWKHLPFLSLSRDQVSRVYADKYMQEHNFTPRVSIKIRNLGLILYSVEHGLGVTICPAMPTINDNHPDRVCYFSLPSENGPMVRQTSIVHRSDAYLSLAEKAFIKIIQEHYVL